jgi:IrrE N-terminal-like domain
MHAMLQTEAKRLASLKSFPLDLFSLLSDLRIGLTFSSVARDPNHSGSVLKRADTWEITVVRPRRDIYRTELVPRERFTVAHELAHCIIEANFGFRPSSQSAYWALERVCNDFAALLLTPTSALDQALAPVPLNAADILGAIQRLRRLTEVSFEVSSRRIVEALTKPTAVAGILINRNQPQLVHGRLSWVHENRLWMGGGRNRKIGPTHPFFALVAEADGMLSGQVRNCTMPGTDSACIVRGGGLSAFFIATWYSAAL